MTDVNGVNNSGVNSTQSSNSSTTAKSEELGQDDFLKLLVAQMSYQDPLEPQENGEFITQMAQFGTVDGIQKLQDSFETLSQALQSNQALQASTLVGQTVEVKANQIGIQEGSAIAGSIDVEGLTQNLNVTVYNEAGEKMNQFSIGNAKEGFLEFMVPGLDEEGNPLPEGEYKLVAEGQVGNETVAHAIYLKSNVNSVTLGDTADDLTLSLAGLGDVRIGDIRKISE